MRTRDLIGCIGVCVAASALITPLCACPGPDDACAVLSKLLNARAVCESDHGGALEAWLRLRPSRAAARDEDSVVMIEQPMWASSVVILVYDPTGIGREKVSVELLEGPVGEPRKQGVVVSLREAYPDSGLFLGRAEVEGSHGTPVLARYSTAGGKIKKQSAVVYMAFH